MTRYANYFNSLYFLSVCAQGVSTIVYLTASGSEVFMLRTVQQHKFQNKFKSRHKQKHIISICDHIFQWEAYSALGRRCLAKYLTSRKSK